MDKKEYKSTTTGEYIYSPSYPQSICMALLKLWITQHFSRHVSRVFQGFPYFLPLFLISRKAFFTTCPFFPQLTFLFPQRRTYVRVKLPNSFFLYCIFQLDIIFQLTFSRCFSFFSMIYQHRWKILCITMKSPDKLYEEFFIPR